MKSGLAVGIIGGIVNAITATFIMVISVLTGYLVDFPPIETIVKIHIVVNIIWGIVFGILYSKLYNSIPRSGIWKGLIYGLIIYLFSNVYPLFIASVYGQLPSIVGYVGGIYVWIIYGLILGYLYKE